jgi:hypothetical protein
MGTLISRWQSSCQHRLARRYRRLPLGGAFLRMLRGLLAKP